MAIVFAVLALLAISIKVVDRIESLTSGSASPAPAPVQASRQPSTKPASQVADPGSPSDESDALTAAAIAVALALEEQAGSVSRSPALAAAGAGVPSNAWVTAGRSREMFNRMSGRPVTPRNNR